MISLRWYQLAAKAAVFDYFANNTVGNCLIGLPTGTGKGYVIADICRDILQRWPDQRILMLTHIKELISQNADKMRELWPLAPLGIYSAGLSQRDTVHPLLFAGVASVYKRIAEFGRIDLLFIDEAHLLSPSDDTMYGSIIEALKAVNPYLRVIGLTATPYRMGQGMLTDGGLFSALCYDMTDVAGFNRLISEGYMSPIYPKPTHTAYDVSNVKIVNGDFDKSQLEAVVDKKDLTHKILEETCYYAADRQCWMFFASGVNHAEHIAECLRKDFRISAWPVHSKMSRDTRNGTLSAFKAGQFRCLVCNNIGTTGFDHPPVDFIGMGRVTTSPGLWVQMCVDEKTEILTATGWAKRGQISVNDKIATYNIDTAEINYSPCLQVIDRDLQENESFYEMNSPGLNFRVTGNHELIIKTKRIGALWRKVEAEKTPTEFLVPINGLQLSSGVQLTENELSLIGWYLSDGTIDKSNNVLSISQSIDSPYIDTIQSLLENEKIPHSTYIHKRNNEYANCIRFKITKPNWVKYQAYLDKNISDEFENLTRDQLLVILEAMYYGDGRKTEYPGRRIVIGTDKTAADRLQSLCIRRAIKCNITTERPKPSEWNSDPKLLYFISYNANKVHSHIKTSLTNLGHIKNSKVWCVTTNAGTIITRRNGKVIIMGNCGRGTRPSIETSKRDCLLLDFAKNTKRLGPINDPLKPRKKGEATGDAPVKICPECGIYNHASARECFACGYLFPFREKLVSTASTDELLRSDAPEIIYFDVQRTLYNFHQSKKKEHAKPCLKVSYICGLKKFDEWVHLDAGGSAGHLAREWWRQRHAYEPPTPNNCQPYPSATHAALSLCRELKQPKKIKVLVNRPYPQVLSVEY